MKIIIDKEKLLKDDFRRTANGFYNFNLMIGFNIDEVGCEIEVIKMTEADKGFQELYEDIAPGVDMDLFCPKNEMPYASKWIKE